ncbi:Kinase, NEK [Giardia lamblia P15]|uniref:Kinase, NEK n=1 Tax=Giardia intestinalis (strain P15) TaxID=658858 RepID=E1EZ34_GIAIA|nr:Kinase, NEK [Giardia lamblia P15]
MLAKNVSSLYTDCTKLAEGGFASLFLARRAQDRTLVVVKEASASQDNDAKAIKSARNEFNIVMRLASPYIVKYYAVRTHDNGSIYHIEMEYCSGGSVQQLIQRIRSARSKLPESAVWEIVAQVLRALQYLHSWSQKGYLGIVHRDIKPENLLIDNKGLIRLCDFGLSMALQTDNPPVVAKRSGTTSYMAPEIQARGAVTTVSDIWSLGCTIWAICTLKHPRFSRRDLLEGPVVDFLGYTTPLRKFVTLLLQPDPNARPTADQLLFDEHVVDALKRIDDGENYDIYPPQDLIALYEEGTVDQCGPYSPAKESILASSFRRATSTLQECSIVLSTRADRCQTPLMAAVSRGDHVSAQKLLMHTGKVDSEGFSALLYAIDVDSLPCVQLLAAFEFHISHPNGDSPLIYALKSGKVELLSELARYCAGSLDASGNTALCIAIRCNDLPAIELLLPYELLLKIGNTLAALDVAWSCLLLHIKEPWQLLTEHLLKHHRCYPRSVSLLGSPKYVKQKTRTMLSVEGSTNTDKSERIEIAEEDLYAVLPCGRTALMLAAQKNAVQYVQLLLLEAGMSTPAGATALLLGMQARSIQAVEILWSYESFLSKATELMRICLLAEQPNKLHEHDICCRATDGSTALMYAAISNNHAAIRMLIMREMRMHTRNGFTALMMAARHDSLDAAKEILPYEARLTDHTGMSALMHASQCGHVRLVSLLAAYEDGMQDTMGRTAFLHAAENRHSSCVHALSSEMLLPGTNGDSPLIHVLLKYGVEHCREIFTNDMILASAGLHNDNGQTATMIAASLGATDIVRLLAPTEAGIQDGSGRTALMYATEVCSLDVMAILLDKEEKLKNINGETALMLAVRSGHSTCIHILAPREASLRNNRYMTALGLAVELDLPELVAILAPYEASTFVRKNESVIDLAVSLCHATCIAALARYMSENQAVIPLTRRSPVISGRTPLLAAVLSNKIDDVVTSLGFLGYGYSLSKTALGKDIICTALQLSVRLNHLDCTKVLLSEIGVYVPGFETALMQAAHMGLLESARLLLPEAGAQTKEGYTALMLAAIGGHSEVVKLLLPFETKTKTSAGRTALMLASAYAKEDCIALLVEQEARLCDHRGVSALMCLGRISNVQQISALIAEELYLQDYNGYSALMYAVIDSNTVLVRELLAELPLKTHLGETALSLAAVYERSAIYELLVEYIVDNNIAMQIPKRAISTPARTELISAVLANDRSRVVQHLDQVFKAYQGYTALMYAATYGYAEIVEILAPHESCIRTRKGCTALMLAAKNGHIDCLLHLRPYEEQMAMLDGTSSLMFAALAGQSDCVAQLLSEIYMRKVNGDDVIALCESELEHEELPEERLYAIRRRCLPLIYAQLAEDQANANVKKRPSTLDTSGQGRNDLH